MTEDTEVDETAARVQARLKERLKLKRPPLAAEPEEIPTPEEIRTGCLSIQATWTPAQRERRRAQVVEPYTIPEVSTEFLAPTLEKRVL